MRQTSIKSTRVADLLDALVARTGESKVDAVVKALESRLRELDAQEASDLTLAWLEASVWPSLPKSVRGRGPSKSEQEELLGL